MPYNKIGLNLILIYLLNGSETTEPPQTSPVGNSTITAETAVKKLKGELGDNCSISNGDIPIYHSENNRMYCRKDIH